jgi:ribonuclease HIII
MRHMPRSFSISTSDAALLRAWFLEQSWAEPIQRPYADFAFRVRGEKLGWIYYSGKGVIVEQGKPGPVGESANAALAKRFPALAPAATDGAAEAKRKTAPGYPYIGGDESGKGDIFGPLVVGAFRADAETEAKLIGLGVRDSKTLSIRQILRLAPLLRTEYPDAYCLRILVPGDYNHQMAAIQAAGGTLHTLLSELHAQCIASLSAEGQATWAIVDAFGDPAPLAARLPRGLGFRAEPRAEAYPAVAAASILAREACLNWFADETLAGRPWPRGSSDPRLHGLLLSLFKEGGADALNTYVKTHFEPAQRLLRGA